MKTLLKNARIIKMINEDIIFGSLVIEDDKIKYIGNDYEPFGPFDIIHDCQNNVIMPGFKNAHTHSAMTFVRSKTDDQTLHDWLFDTIFPREAKLQEEDVYHLAKGAYLEYLTSGITACFDQYYFPLMSAKAAKEMGMRIVLLGTYNENNNNVDDIVRLYHEFNDENGLVSYCLGIHAEYTASEKELYWMKEAVHILKAPFYTHISETSNEVEECYRKRGMSPVAYLDSLGLFDYGGGGYHCCYFSDEDIEIFKKRHCSIVTCPGSNTKLASGIAPVKKYLENDINVALGTDGPASNNCLDMFKEMTLVHSLQKVTLKDPTVLPAFTVLKMATVNGAKAMGLYDADVLDINKKADLIEIDLSRPNMRPLNNIINNIVYSGSKDNIKMTMINGKILYLDHKFYIDEDIEKIYEKMEEITLRIEKEYSDAR